MIIVFLFCVLVKVAKNPPDFVFRAVSGPVVYTAISVINALRRSSRHFLSISHYWKVPDHQYQVHSGKTTVLCGTIQATSEIEILIVHPQQNGILVFVWVFYAVQYVFECLDLTLPFCFPVQCCSLCPATSTCESATSASALRKA